VPGNVAHASVRVRYGETDQMGVVYYANYLVWMEVARVAYCRHAGFEYRDMEREGGAFLVVTEAHCRYRAPARFDDQIDLACWVAESRSRTVRFSYEMCRGDEVLATGETLHTVTNATGKTIRMPGEYRRYFPRTS
jgi:acyl-CoA thioester hydrolase